MSDTFWYILSEYTKFAIEVFNIKNYLFTCVLNYLLSSRALLMSSTCHCRVNSKQTTVLKKEDKVLITSLVAGDTDRLPDVMWCGQVHTKQVMWLL